jgi:hypothetical protein
MGREHLGELGIDWRVILKWTLTLGALGNLNV